MREVKYIGDNPDIQGEYGMFESIRGSFDEGYFYHEGGMRYRVFEDEIVDMPGEDFDGIMSHDEFDDLYDDDDLDDDDYIDVYL